MSKDLELLKVEIFAGYLQSRFDSLRSLFHTGFISLYILICTFTFERIFSNFIYMAIGILIGGVLGMIFYVFFVKRILGDMQSENLAYINVLLTWIKEGHELPSLSSLENMDKDSFQQ